MIHHEVVVGPATIGGPLGSSTGLLVGSIFYDKHSIVTDEWVGEFHEERASALIERVNALSVRYGHQMAFDVIAAAEEAMEKYLAFVASRTELPILINATDPDVRIAGLATAGKLGILDRCIFASLNEDTEDAELDALREYRPAGVMILASNIADLTPDGTCDMISGYFRPLLDDIGVKVPIVDLGTMDAPSIGLNLRGITAVRERFGYPAGCAFSNCFPQWTGLAEQGTEYVNLSLAAALVACRMAGGDFLHYGIIEKAHPCVHASATAEVFLGFASQELDGNPMDPDHCLYKMFKLGSQ